MKLKFIFIALTGLLASCIDDEEILISTPKTPAETKVVDMGETYENKIYYSLNKNAVVKTVDPYSWDIAFNCADNKFSLKMNTSNKASGIKMVTSDFNSVISNPDFLSYEVPYATSDKSIFSKWATISNGVPISFNYVYVINRGIRFSTNKELKYKKIQFLNCNDGVYEVQFANLDNSELRTARIKKDTNFNFVYFSFDANNTVDQEPNKNDWDIEFTRYTVEISKDFFYSVNGILSNPYQSISTAIDSNNIDYNYPFTSQKIQEYSFNSAIDAIGWDWKTFDFTNANSTYKIKSNRMYIIKKNSTDYFKLKFIDFYRVQEGKLVKGSPTFFLEKMFL